jgi:serine/threonine protein phosphatase PrpC
VISAKHAHLAIDAVSHPGMSGKSNEDRFGVSAYRLGQDLAIPSVLAIVADGIGGHRAGEVAAELAVETISDVIASSEGSRPVELLRRAVVEAGYRIYEAAESQPERHGMGATCACAWVIGDRLYTVSVGDSRIYLIRDGQIHQLTTDHTWIQEAVEQGLIHPNQVRSHPNAHVIRRYLGSRSPVVPDLRLRLAPQEGSQSSESNQGYPLRIGDTLLLCSDGLTDLLEDDEILRLVNAGPLASTLNQMVDLANIRGGHDNITIIALRVPAPPKPTIPSVKPLQPVPARKQRWPVYLLAALGVLLLGLTAGGIYLASILGGSSTPVPDVQASALPGALPSATPVATAPADAVTQPSPTAVQPGGGAPGATAPPAFGPTYTAWPTNTASPP